MFTIDNKSSSIGVYYDSGFHQHLLAGTKGYKIPETVAHVNFKANQLCYPAELFDEVDYALDGSSDYTKFEFYLEACARYPLQQEKYLSRLRPLLPIPYWDELGLVPPIYTTLHLEHPPKGQISSEFIAHQTYKLRDFMKSKLKQALTCNNTGLLGLNLRQLDKWGMTLTHLNNMKRCRPIIIATEGQVTSLNRQMLSLYPKDAMSMRGQISLMKYVALRTVSELQYGNIQRLIGLYSTLSLDGQGLEERDNLQIVDPFGLALPDPAGLLRLQERARIRASVKD